MALRWHRSILPVVLLALGVGATFWVSSYEPGKAAQGSDESPVVEVEVVRVEPVRRPAEVHGTGRVEASQQLSLTSEVTGRVVHVSPELQPGGRVEEGDLLVRVDPHDYRANLASRRSELAQAKLAVEQAEAQKEVASLSVERAAVDEPTTDLALKRPQLRARRASLKAAEAAVERARRDLQRTRVRAPWPAAVVSADVDVGQHITPGQPLAELVGTDRFWVQVAVPLSALSDLEIGEDGEASGSPARISQHTEQHGELSFEGRLVRRIPALAQRTQRALLLVEVRKPLHAETPLLPEAQVDVVLQGKPVEGLLPLPASALHGGRFVWRVDGQERLERVAVDVAFTGPVDAEEVVLRPGSLQAGDRVVTSRLPDALEGSRVRVADGRPEGDGK